MLIISVALNEAVYIGDEIQVRLLGIDRNKVRLGFTAPRDILIEREGRRRLRENTYERPVNNKEPA